MKITILTLFPEMFDSYLNNSIIKRAISKEIVSFNVINIRDYTLDKHHRVDNPPIGGGAGLIMMCQPVVDALNDVNKNKAKVIMPYPKGKTFNQEVAKKLSSEDELVFICGHYEGIDERILNFVDETYSLGDFILTGGEIPVMAMTDSIIRLIEGVIAKESIEDESFSDGLLEYPQYTAPYDYQGYKVPDILFSGNHTAINKWRRKQALIETKNKRPDMFEKIVLSKQDKKLLDEINQDDMPKWEKDALVKGAKFLKK